MIIRCTKCETTFRFDDGLMTGEGVWVRCSRCRNIFFQDNPSPDPPSPDVMLVKNDPDQTEAREAAATGYGPGEALPAENFPQAGVPEEEEEPILSRTHDIQDEGEETEGFGLRNRDFQREDAAPDGEVEEEIEKLFAKPEMALKKKKKSHRLARFIGYMFLALVFLLIAAGVGLWFFPETLRPVVDFFSPYLPVKGIMGQQIPDDAVLGQVNIQDVRQHVVNNWLMGNMRVVEGVAVNVGSFPLTRLQVRGRAYDGSGGVLGEGVSYCGNVLSDTELATMTEDEIQSRLSQVSGNNAANDRVVPQGRIPFMVVLANHEQRDVAKTTVMVVGAEKLLE